MYEIWLILHALIHGFHTPCSQLLGVRNEFYSVSTPPPPKYPGPMQNTLVFPVKLSSRSTKNRQSRPSMTWSLTDHTLQSDKRFGIWIMHTSLPCHGHMIVTQGPGLGCGYI